MKLSQPHFVVEGREFNTSGLPSVWSRYQEEIKEEVIQTDADSDLSLLRKQRPTPGNLWERNQGRSWQWPTFSMEVETSNEIKESSGKKKKKPRERKKKS